MLVATILVVAALALALIALFGCLTRAWRAACLLRACRQADRGAHRPGWVIAQGHLIALTAFSPDAPRDAFLLRLILDRRRGATLEDCRSSSDGGYEGPPPPSRRELWVQGFPLEQIPSTRGRNRLRGQEVMIHGPLTVDAPGRHGPYRESRRRGIVGTPQHPATIATLAGLRRRVLLGLLALPAAPILGTLTGTLICDNDLTVTTARLSRNGPPRPRIAAAADATCAIRAGRVYCWGRPYDAPKATAHWRRIPGIVDVVAVSAGYAHFCALRRGGRVACWGENNRGQLGVPAPSTRRVTAVPGIADAVQVMAFDRTSCALSRGGAVHCWGQTREVISCGRMDCADAAWVDHPQRVRVGGIREIFRSYPLICGRKANGSVWCWGGENRDGASFDRLAVREKPALRGTRQLSRHAHYPHWYLLSLDARGGLRAHADDLHLGSDDGNGAEPRAVRLSGLQVRDVAHLDCEFCLLHGDGGQVACGKLREAAAGAGLVLLDRKDLAQIDDVAELVAGVSHFCARRRSDQIACWGDNSWGQLGIATAPASSSVRVPVVGVEDAEQVIARGDDSTCLVLADGTLACWGNFNAYAVVHEESGHGRAAPERRIVVATQVARATAACVLLRGGEVRCWDGTGRLRVLTRGVRQLAGSAAYTCALRGGGTVSCWYSGETIPRPVRGLKGARALAVGLSHACALLERGQVACWGKNHHGQLGLGSSGPRVDRPRRVPGLRDVAEIVAASEHTCARLRSGRVRCWGNCLDGQCSDGSRRIIRGPVEIALAHAIRLYAFGGGACAQLRDGEVRCWGDDSFGVEGLPRPLLAPTGISWLRGRLRQISREYLAEHTCAVLENGRVWCWGKNDIGQLGADFVARSATPVWIEDR
jgi:alpha-tubulin suppressor-like RCC1 family protein